MTRERKWATKRSNSTATGMRALETAFAYVVSAYESMAGRPARKLIKDFRRSEPGIA